ncbi:MAG TPA: glycosyltransferase family 39 protein [Gemmataceae bacterium]|nr:glycosyltransferase family 39 protein [Gemmataceae bacterium]
MPSIIQSAKTARSIRGLDSIPPLDPRKEWWRRVEWEVVLLAGAVAAIFLARLPDMSIRGEESRWATVAMEMIRSGDWVVPRQQGEAFLSRPPLGSWLIGACSLLGGECDVWAIRLPSVVATLLTSLLIYGYSRLFLSRLGAFTAGIAYATMGQVLQLGRVGETEAVFTLFVSASLLVWHWGYVKQWPDTWMWIVGYGLSALGALAKGPQAPVYFVAITSILLFLRRDWRRVVSWQHLVGISVFAAIIAFWQIPFFLKMGWPGVHAVWASDTAMRIWEINPLAVAKHLVTYPFEVLGCTLPWSLFLLLYFSRTLRREIGSAWSMVLFLTTCLAVTFPSCWMIPGAHGRYFMPLFPCMAPMIGLMVERCGTADSDSLRKIWRTSLGGMSLIMGGLALAIISASWLGFPSASVFIQERSFSLHYAGLAAVLAAFLWWQRSWVPTTPPTTRAYGLAGVCAAAVFLGLTYDTVVLNFIVRKNGPAAEQVASLKERLPEGQALISFGPIHHLFAFHFHDPIERQDWPITETSIPGQMDYFCFDRNRSQAIPFAWEEIAAISCDRDRTDNPDEVVIVGRRLAGNNPK